jgi:hypothetical protein
MRPWSSFALSAQLLDVTNQHRRALTEPPQCLLNSGVIQRIFFHPSGQAAADVGPVHLYRALADAQALGNCPTRHPAAHEPLYHPLSRRQDRHALLLLRTIPHKETVEMPLLFRWKSNSPKACGDATYVRRRCAPALKVFALQQKQTCSGEGRAGQWKSLV